LGAVKAALLLGAVFLGMASYPHTETQEMMNRSNLAPALADGTQLVIVAIPQEYKEWLCSGIENLREMARARAIALRATPALSIPQLLSQHNGPDNEDRSTASHSPR
jgi:hypothetical protein